MSNDLLQTIQQNMGYAPLQKVDANEWQSVFAENKAQEELCNEAVIPAVLTGLFRYSQIDKGADDILHAQLSADWTTFIFDGHTKEIVENIADYSHCTTETITTKISAVAEEAVRVIRKRVTNTGSIKNLRIILADSLDDVLFRLPVHMQIGEFLHENAAYYDNQLPGGPAAGSTHIMGGSLSKAGANENRPLQ